MRIVFDCFKLVKGAGKSIGIYNFAVNMVKSMAANRNMRNDRLIVLGNKYNRKDFEISGVTFIEVKKYDPLNRIHFTLWELFLVSTACRKLKADRVVFPRGFAPLFHTVDDVIVIHDLIPYYYDENYPGYFNAIENTYIKTRLKDSARFCSRVITISDASAADIIKRFGICRRKISVIHNSCSAIQIPEDNNGGVMHSEKTPYIIAITSALPHKNAAGIIRAYERYYETVSDPLDIIVIGIEDTGDVKISDKALSHVKCIKYLEDNADLYRLISGAKLMLFLSLIEGFGFPPLEAMQMGTPVICSNTSSLPEVVGDAALLVDPEDADFAANAMKELIDDENLQKTLVQKGYENIKRFSQETRAELYWKAVTFRKTLPWALPWRSGLLWPH